MRGSMKRIAQFTNSKIPFGVRHEAGNYYRSAKVGGKLIRRSLAADACGQFSEQLAGVGRRPARSRAICQSLVIG